MTTIWLECEECESEYEAHEAEMPPHRCGECEAAAEDRFLDESDSEHKSESDETMKTKERG